MPGRHSFRPIISHLSVRQSVNFRKVDLFTKASRSVIFGLVRKRELFRETLIENAACFDG